MRINEIIIQINPWHQPHEIELKCSMQIDGKTLHWQELFPDDDFESRVERYLDYMKRKIIDVMKKESKKG